MKNNTTSRSPAGSPSHQIPKDSVLHDRSGLPVSDHGVAMKVCKKCGELRLESDYYKAPNPNRPNRMSRRCKFCVSECAKARYRRNGGRSEYNKEFRQANLARIRLYRRVKDCGLNTVSDGSVTEDAIKSLLMLQHNRCAVSGADLNVTGWQIDHIWPKDKGGENSMHNIQIVSPKINEIKSKYIPWAYCHQVPLGWFIEPASFCPCSSKVAEHREGGWIPGQRRAGAFSGGAA